MGGHPQLCAEAQQKLTTCRPTHHPPLQALAARAQVWVVIPNMREGTCAEAQQVGDASREGHAAACVRSCWQGGRMAQAARAPLPAARLASAWLHLHCALPSYYSHYKLLIFTLFTVRARPQVLVGPAGLEEMRRTRRLQVGRAWGNCVCPCYNDCPWSAAVIGPGPVLQGGVRMCVLPMRPPPPLPPGPEHC